MARPVQMPSAPASATIQAPPADDRPRGANREYVTTSIRFKSATLAKLKKTAIDRNESLQEMIEIALSKLLEVDGVKIPGLRK